MSIPRLTFLYPHLFKPLRVHHAGLVSQPLRVASNHLSKAAFSTTSQPTQEAEAYPQRYGTAAEPQPPPPGTPMPEKPRNDKSLAGAIEQEVNTPSKQEEKKQIKAPPKKEPDKTASEPKDEADKSRDWDIDAALRDPSKRATELDASKSTPKDAAQAAEAAEAAETARRTKPLETVLQMGPPTEEKAEEHKAPHLQAPPYVHHFDTFSLVKDLEGGGFSEDQSVTVMKAIRGLLALNLDVAKEGLVSKSDVENETYLFRAACSELRTEILNTRKSSTTKTRTLLSHLQHTTDILSQRTTQETQALKDDLKGMLNDRRMAVRMQQQSRDSEISELNYKISVALNSDSKSEVEGLRWVLTRRAAMAIATMALLILGSLRYGSYKIHEAEMEQRKREMDKSHGSSSAGSGSGGGRDGGGRVGSGGGMSFTVQSRDVGTQAGGEGREDKGVGGSEKPENVGYVSLG